MHHYIVEKIGDGSRQNPFRPDFNGSYVWSPAHKCKSCDTYIIVTNEESDDLYEVTNLEQACEARGLEVEDVINWFVGD